MSEFSTISQCTSPSKKSLERAYNLSIEKSKQSFSQCLGNSFRQTVAGIFSDRRMKPSVMLEGHIISTKARISQSEGEYILVAQDTTYYNYRGHCAMAGLGKIQGKVLGIMQHNLLAISELGIPLGVLGQEYWSRESSQNYQGKESEKWLRGLATVNQELGETDKKVVLIQDREADIYSFFQAQRAKSVDLIVRVHEPRKLEIVESGEIYKLEEMREKLPVVGEKPVTILRKGKEITLVLSLRAGKVNVLGGKKNQTGKAKTEGLSLVIAEEKEAFERKGKSVFDPEERAIWYLLTSLPIENQAEIERVTIFYALRWRIERFHYTLKSGALEVEKLQFDDLETTINGLTFYSIVGWQILAIVYLTREEKDQVASVCFEEKEIAILEVMSRKVIKTVKEATLALVKLAGFAPSKRQPMPGIKVLAQSLERFHYIKFGFEAKPI